MRRWEVLDEEKRARMSVISHCGIDALRCPEIPFGIRALQNGIEVEGIWISRHNTPRSRHTTLPVTPVACSVDTPKGKGKMADLGYSNSPSIYSASNCPRTDYTPLFDLSCGVPSTMPAESPQSRQTSSSYRSRSKQVTSKLQIQQNPLKGICDDQYWNENARPSFRNPFIPPAPTLESSSFNKSSTTASKPNSPALRLGPCSLTETRFDRYVARVSRGDVVVLAGFRPEVLSHAPRKAYSEGCSSPYRLGMLPTQNNITPPRPKLREMKEPETGHISSSSPNST
ncbi:hypothetical protein B0T10DRAFT_543439 [Thelonectria olida]|uniref:Uncharacterized protein n=1 Tax=Thelonectria olida TaxID=1576542 RepID=A0A9P8WJH0_9HYPO|nr:hypothetical protein B0T10DRAFT_543439 [Thelonectria olida]